MAEEEKEMMGGVAVAAVNRACVCAFPFLNLFFKGSIYFSNVTHYYYYFSHRSIVVSCSIFLSLSLSFHLRDYKVKKFCGQTEKERESNEEKRKRGEGSGCRDRLSLSSSSSFVNISGMQT